MVTRKRYIEKLKKLKDKQIIKVITGVRRCGKSTLLKQFIAYLKTCGVPDSRIISLNFENVNNEHLLEYHALHSYVSERLSPDEMTYVFLDEIQTVNNFQKAVDSLFVMDNVDIYITGSNAFLLSSDLATLFTGRKFEIEVYPFSFKEYLEYFQYEDIDKAFDKYVMEGGMSGSYLYNSIDKKYDYLNDIYNTLIVRDIFERNKIKDEKLMSSLNDFLMDNISNRTSLRNVANSLNNINLETNHKTVGNYIEYLCEAFAFYKMSRYDIKGKKYLSSDEKYYLCDHAFRYARLGTKSLDYGRVYENIVAIELLRRGYEVYTGILYNKEVDFIALKRNEKVYIQVSDNIEYEKTLKREAEPLLQIKDAYPKIIIARTKHEDYQYEGIQIYDIANWLAK